MRSLAAAGLFWIWSGVVFAAPPAEVVVQGLYEGTWRDAAGSAEAEVRVVAMGKGSFRMLARRQLAGKIVRAEIDGTTEKDAVTFVGRVEGLEWKAAWADGAIRGTIGTDGSLDIRRVRRKPPTLGKKPPPDAVVLLDGKNFDNLVGRGKTGRLYLTDASKDGLPVWEVRLEFTEPREPPVLPSKENPLPPGWEIVPGLERGNRWNGIGEDGSIQVPTGTGMESKQAFPGGFDAHVEFLCTLRATGRGQGRGNSGVYLPNGQEIQILDSFGSVTYFGGGCGGIYGKKDPDTMEPIPSLQGVKENSFTLASLPPDEWQTFDFEFRVKKGESRVKKGEKDAGQGLLTVYHNGIKIHDTVETRVGSGRWYFQHHGDPVRFRNIWVLPIGDP